MLLTYKLQLKNFSAATKKWESSQMFLTEHIHILLELSKGSF